MIDCKIPTIIDLDIYGTLDHALYVADFAKHLPFRIKRQYLITSHAAQQDGGQHAHKQLWQLFICVQGSCQIVFEGKGGKFEFSLDTPAKAVLVPPGYWRDYQLPADSSLSVLASEPYDENDYIRDYDEFQRYLDNQSRLVKVPFVTLERENAALKTEIISCVEQQILANDWVLGNSVQEFETAFARYCEVKYAVGCGNGLDALVLALRAYGIGVGHQVIVPTNSFIATALAVSQTGATPIFIDCLPCSGAMDIDQLEAMISSQVKAIIPVHLYGIPVDMERILTLADKHQLFVLEDAAQAHGALYKGKKIGSLGHAAAFSFYPTKNLGAFGDGGCVVTNDAQLADKIRLLANYGSKKKYIHQALGVNSRLDSLQARFLMLKLPQLDDWNARRCQLADIYYQHLSAIKEVTLPKISEDIQPVWHIFSIFLDNQQQRDALQAYLSEHGISSSIHYPIPIHASDTYAMNEVMNEATKKATREHLPIAEKNATRQLSLPISPYLTEDEVIYVCQHIKDFCHMIDGDSVFNMERK